MPYTDDQKGQRKSFQTEMGKKEDIMDNVIVTRNLCKTYGRKEAVSGINMHIRKGEIYGFIGRNGSGKSTTLKLLSGLANPTGGEISVFGGSLKDEAVRRRMGVLIESAGLDPDKSAYENMLLKAIMMGIINPGTEIRELLTKVGLDPNDKKCTRKFSMGMKQRLGIAMALLGGPDLLLLDEPINGLDPEGMNAIRSYLVELNEKRGMTILVSSHILGELSKMATCFGIIKDGCLIQELTSEELNARCRDYLYLKTGDTKTASVILEQRLGITDYEVRPDGEIRIFQETDSAAVTQEMAKAGVDVYSVYAHQQDLEGYFIELMGQEEKQQGGRHHA